MGSVAQVVDLENVDTAGFGPVNVVGPGGRVYLTDACLLRSRFGEGRYAERTSEVIDAVSGIIASVGTGSGSDS